MQLKPQFFRFMQPHLSCQLGLVSLALGMTGGLQPAQAQIVTDLNFAPPPMETPGNREAGGGRNDTCADTASTSGMMAIVPSTNTGLTLEASPDLFVYLPPNAAETAELRIFDEATGEELYAGEFAQPEHLKSVAYPAGGAIVKLPLAEAGVTLAPEASYLWAVFVVCDRTNRAADIVIDSGLQRVGDNYISTLPTDVAEKLTAIASATSEDQLLTYGAAGLWQDLLTDLSALAEADPANYGVAWEPLLSDHGMAAIADVPIFTTSFSPLAQ